MDQTESTEAIPETKPVLQLADASMLEHLPAYAMVRQDSRFVYLNGEARRAVGVVPGEVVLVDKVLLGAPSAKLDDSVDDSAVDFSAGNFDCIMTSRLGKPQNISCQNTAIEFEGAPAHLIIAVGRTAGLYEELRGHGTFLEELLDSSPEALAIVHRRRVLHVNHEFTRLFGYTSEEVMGQFLDELIIPAGHEHERDLMTQGANDHERSYLETVRRTKEGQIVDVSVLMAPVRIGGDEVGHFISYRDIRRQKKVEAELQHSALHDSLTGLANRVLFLDRLQRRPERNFAIMFLDLDRFKQVNDSLGHANGDTLLLKITERLQLCLRPHDTIARFGGDEFAVLLDEVASMEDTIRIAARIQAAVREPVDIAGHEVRVSASIGIVLGSPEYASAEQIMRDADFAMYRAKSNGKGRHEIFDNTMMARATVQKEMQSQLRDAVEQRQFEVWYQPVYNIARGEIESFEALLRWRHPLRGLVPVAEFMKIAEDTGMILPMGALALEVACSQAKAWVKRYPETPVSVSVNLSPLQFVQPNLPEMVAAVLRDSELEPQYLLLEITESSITLEPAAAERHLKRLTDMGVRVALDNFGAGLASMTNLLRLPFNLLKLDRRLTSVLPARGTQAALIETIFGLGHSLHMRMQADGVETMPQLQELERFGCELAQGYLFSPALTAEQAEACLQRKRWTVN